MAIMTDVRDSDDRKTAIRLLHHRDNSGVISVQTDIYLAVEAFGLH